MIISYLYNKDEINKMADGFLVALKKLSFNMPNMFDIDDIKDIKNNTKKLVILDLRPIYHEDEFELIDNSIKELTNLDGFLFSDLGLVSIFSKYNVLSKAIYAPLTFNSTSFDIDFFNGTLLNNLVLSSDLTKKRIEEILNSKENQFYSYISFGYSQIFYSYRKHFTNYDKYYNDSLNLHNDFFVTLKEATRDEYYHVIEDDRSFRIFKDKLFNAFSCLDINRFKYVFLDRLFVEDELYFDTINLYLNKMNKDDYFNKYNKGIFNNQILFNEVGLLKEDSL